MSSDPFEEFARSLDATEQATKKIVSETPPPPKPGETFENLIDYFSQLDAQTRAVSGLQSGLRKSAAELIKAQMGTIPYGTSIFHGHDAAIEVSRGLKKQYDRAKLRALDVGSGDEPVKGLKVSYSVKDDDLDPAEAAIFDDAKTGEKDEIKIKVK